MKKRAMKKWIPKNTCYCYDYITGTTCKWWRQVGIKYYDRKNCDYYLECISKKQCTGCKIGIYECKYLNYIDYDESSLLFDMCKECSVSNTPIEFMRKRRK